MSESRQTAVAKPGLRIDCACFGDGSASAAVYVGDEEVYRTARYMPRPNRAGPAMVAAKAARRWIERHCRERA